MEDIKDKLLRALKTLFQKDYSLIQRDCNERSVSFRLGIYLNNIFEQEGYDVDCEYNRNKYDKKQLGNGESNYPDIIVHKRGVNENNLLYIEVKKYKALTKNNYETDKRKLLGFTTSSGDYKYKLGAHVIFSYCELHIIWYSDGNLLNVDSYSVLNNSLSKNPQDIDNRIITLEEFYKDFV